MLGIIGVVSGFFQKFLNLFLVDTSYFIRSAVFIGLIGIAYTIFEKTGVYEKKVHFIIGLGIILFGITFDYMMA
ncbi:hypothetical protein [Metabacillus litoralis]|uniref:hypothetical protein n=1 Tax=Metabacillus litoralis TaxID=152268 RepID=UPI001CFCEEAF|nr:hypothetical protein [Metabacillus litoralis]